jgi:hypothetical protein
MPLKSYSRHPTRGQTLCKICQEPVDLRASKRDGDGKAVHEQCYLDKVKVRSDRAQGKPPTDEAGSNNAL